MANCSLQVSSCLKNMSLQIFAELPAASAEVRFSLPKPCLDPQTGKPKMQEDRFNMSMRKFLKQVGVTSQRELERIVREQRPARGPLRVKMVLTAEGTNLNHVVEDEIDLD
jgi:hypothetical protein